MSPNSPLNLNPACLRLIHPNLILQELFQVQLKNIFSNTMGSPHVFSLTYMAPIIGSWIVDEGTLAKTSHVHVEGFPIESQHTNMGSLLLSQLSNYIKIVIKEIQQFTRFKLSEDELRSQIPRHQAFLSSNSYIVPLRLL